MRKTKENLAHPALEGDSQSREAQESATEEHYEAVGGETSTEGVGRGFDEDEDDASVTEKAEASADGPLSGDVNDPPTKPKPRVKRNNRKHGIAPPHGRSNHAAANSSKTI